MVAIVNTGRSIRAAFHYNESKVSEGVAELIMAGNYPLDLADMTGDHRLLMLLKTAAQNDNIQRPSVHISLNFAPEEQLIRHQLQAIAAEYIERIGFGGQPFLVYEHRDVAHQHLHIVTLKVRPDGTPIRTQNIGKIQSENARKALELKYGLVKAEDHSRGLFQLKPLDTKKVTYGKTQTRRAIAGVLAHVLKAYKYTSLAELNAVLKLYNVAAEPGAEGSRTRRHKGLFYHVLDAGGNKIGTPIKASLFHDKPTLPFLEDRFAVNDALRQPHKPRLKSNIDFALLHGKTTLAEMVRQLSRKGIDTVLHENEQGRAYGITFVDHQAKCVWNGSDLGKTYSAHGILARCKTGADRQQTSLQKGIEIPPEQEKKVRADIPGPVEHPAPSEGISSAGNGLIDALMQTEYGADQVPSQWRSRRKRRRKNQSKNL